MTTGQHLIGGRYELGELLGRGGMAEVRKGTDTRLGRVVAIKRLRTDLASDATFQARFRREAQSSASLNHPAIVAVYDTGEERSTDGSDVAQPYIVMEYVAGRTLREILREGRKILPERALEITSGVLSALDYSHRAGIIHRDIKPGNVMLTPSGDVKVMDFGIARAISDASSTMTQTAAVVGTAQYLSPEQARGETVDSRSDVYSAGCLLYELLTGRPPFVGDSPVAVAYQHVREPALPAVQPRHRPPGRGRRDRDEEPGQAGRGPLPVGRRHAQRHRALPRRPTRPRRGPPGASGRAGPDPRPHGDRGRRQPSRRRSSGAAGPPCTCCSAILVVALIAGAAYLLPKMFESPPDDVRVPDLIGQTEDEARALIGDAGLSDGDRTFEASDDVPKGTVISQEPNPDQFVAPGTEIDFVVSQGKPQVEVPFVIGQQREEARTVLIGAGLRVKFEERESDQPAGQVLETKPAQGQQVAENSVVTVVYSDGPEKIPNVVGMTQQQAEKALREAGYVPDVVPSDETTKPKGTVIQQSPPAGEAAQEGATVTIVVSTFQEPTEPPVTDGHTDRHPDVAHGDARPWSRGAARPPGAEPLAASAGGQRTGSA